MDPADKATEWAQTISEGLNCLGVFLCGPALAKFRTEAPALLQRWESDYAPRFRQLSQTAPGGDLGVFGTALARISTLVGGSIDLDSPEQLASLRGAMRELITALGFPLPSLSAADAAVCELHGAACPVLSGEA
jgi:hypothetical protein